MQTTLYGKIKEGRETKHTLPSIAVTQHNTRQRRVRHLLIRIKDTY